ncbi:MAG: DUF349 domain-containing protein [Dermatophilaceae bacterium]
MTEPPGPPWPSAPPPEPGDTAASGPLPSPDGDAAPEAAHDDPPAPGPAHDDPPAPAPAPRAPVPSPAMFARSTGAPAAAAFGRVDEAGIVYVRTDEGEREVGSYPGASAAEALAYFGRKYDELAASVQLLHQRVTQTDMAVKEAREAAGRLRESVAQARVVGDLAALAGRLDEVEEALDARRAVDAQHRAAAKAQALARREALVAEAEQIAGQPESRVQWKSSGARMRELLEDWKGMQRSGPRIDKDAEAGLWHRFSAARNGFDKARRTHFAQLDADHAQARTAKERLVAEAERLSSSRDWAATAGAFKRLMDDWRRAGRATRGDDDALWERFKSAQDAFFAAKDEVVAAEDEALRANLAVKQALLAEAEALLPVSDLEKAKAALRVIQDRWDRAGRVPRADLERTEKALRRVEQAVRDLQERRWSSANPEAAARAQSLVDQLERAVRDLEADLAKARDEGDRSAVADAEAALTARRDWLAQARAGLAEFGPSS